MKNAEFSPPTTSLGATRPGAICPTGACDDDARGDLARWLGAIDRASGIEARAWPTLPDAHLDALFASAGRLVGPWPLPPEAGEGVAGRPGDEVARMAVLAIRVGRAGDGGVAVVEERYRCGDNRERAAVLRCLEHLPHPARFLRVAIHACRTNVVPVFASIACDNAYPCNHFPEPAFNQMVLKALFVGLSVRRIVGLDRRRSPELARMAAGYASERRAAGRTVPADVAILTGGLDR